MKKWLFLICLPVLQAKAQSERYNEISLESLMKLKSTGQTDMLIIDVRTDGEFYDTLTTYEEDNIGRIQGAKHISLRQLQQDSLALEAFSAYRNKPVYLICSHSYRSRSASKILLKRGFTNVTNVQGGMTEWFRRSDQMASYRPRYYESEINYQLIGPPELWKALKESASIRLISLTTAPIYFFDTLNQQLNQYLPGFKNAKQYSLKDSLSLLNELQGKEYDKIVLYNMVRTGAARLADWLTKKGIKNLAVLVGGAGYFAEFLNDRQLTKESEPLLRYPSKLRFESAGGLCRKLNSNSQPILVDIRPDSLYGKLRTGLVYNYRYLQGAHHFDPKNGITGFENVFPDRNRKYILFNLDGYRDIEFARKMADRGYNVSWLYGGLLRFEWQSINQTQFVCRNLLIE